MLEPVERSVHRCAEIQRVHAPRTGMVPHEIFAQLLRPYAGPVRGTARSQPGQQIGGQIVDAERPEALDLDLGRGLPCGLLFAPVE